MLTDCGRVHDWIEGQNALGHAFTSREEVQAYANEQGGNFWECVDQYDFETKIVILRHTSKRTSKSWMQLHRVNRETNRFQALDLDEGAKQTIRDFLGEMV